MRTNAAARVRLSEALEPFVLALDIGSTASRGDVFDASGRPLKGGRVKVPHHFTTGGDGTSEIDPDAVAGEVEQIQQGCWPPRQRYRVIQRKQLARALEHDLPGCQTAQTWKRPPPTNDLPAPFDRLVGFYDFDQIHQVPRTLNLVSQSSRSFVSV